jgi:hypothetical protein
MVENKLKPTRRIVTGVNSRGRSFIAEDGVSPAIMMGEAWVGFRNNNIWRTMREPLVGAPDTILDHSGVLPPPGGTVIRIIDLPPEPRDVEERKAAMAGTFKELFNDADHRPDERHPGMHVTDTVDYAILLQGELVAIMDEAETVMRAGDVLIQRGTNHAWANRSGEMARVAFILIDAKR